ncbi:hypothetical protein QR680_004690 [Steinernema hermaphroditum]|uniref:Uncharacterized protein n=1 Tax=Steinernema hermaphroditum TaxID=289476 RepID=A0AA39LUD9_9BILA|nr:hypothetical protein QR680_004690 [Steinernema hermaphroditum]
MATLLLATLLLLFAGHVFGQTPCNAQGEWTQWSTWSLCPVVALLPQNNVQTRIRSCQQTPPGCTVVNGFICLGSYSDEKACATTTTQTTTTSTTTVLTTPRTTVPPTCSSVGQWGEWEPWDQCPVISFIPQYNVQRRLRSCQKSPSGCTLVTNYSCSGSYAETRACSSATTPSPAVTTSSTSATTSPSTHLPPTTTTAFTVPGSSKPTAAISVVRPGSTPSVEFKHEVSNWWYNRHRQADRSTYRSYRSNPSNHFYKTYDHNDISRSHLPGDLCSSGY